MNKSILQIKRLLTFGKLWPVLIIIFIMFYWVSLPHTLFNDPISTVIEDKDGNLLGAKIADDGQWRFPGREGVPEKFEKAVLTFEDNYFYYHIGFNPVSLYRAAFQDILAKRIVSGGSTLTMQVIRLSRKGKPRNFYQKIVEIILASRLELTNSKKHILSLYASNAPFGGNVVGLEAASWRYFGRSSLQLSWAETATLAVLPNSPSLIHPGKNRELLMNKRNFLLKKLLLQKVIDATTYKMALLEPLPDKPLPLPQITPHLLNRIYLSEKGNRIVTTIEPELQNKMNDIINRHYNILKYNKIYNAAAVIIEVETGNVLAYIGNTISENTDINGQDVDIIMSPRSTGSILKPFLYAAMLDEGKILPASLVPDIPMQYGSFSPKNYNYSYDGAVPAKQALARSLNVPAVHMLKAYGIDRFHHLLKNLGFSTIDYPADHYGLTLILGGAETNLWDLTAAYASMARTLIHYSENNVYYTNDFRSSDYHFVLPVIKEPEGKSNESGLLSAASIWFTFNAMVEVNRPESDANWKWFSSKEKIAWKTGTSFGNRDAWAVGVTKKYVVGVWVGNASGEGRPGLTGIGAAAPVLFDIYNVLPNTPWFSPPLDELRKVAICRKSGYKAGIYCKEKDSVYIPERGLHSPVCPYHQLVHLTKDRKYRVNSNCENTDDMIHESWFILPPVEEWYYKSKNPDYRILPPYKPGCNDETIPNMDMIYPKNNAKIYIPVEMEGNKGKVIFEVAHRKPSMEIYWHIDNRYVGMTKYIHQLELQPSIGKHILTLVDENGETLTRYFEIIDKKKSK